MLASLDRARMWFGRVLVVLTALVLLAACATGRSNHPSLRVLFIGNSLTYVANLPAVFDTLASQSARPTHREMLVSGGATLSERLADGSAERALKSGAYDIVVLQERGGDFLGGFKPDSGKRADDALRELAALALRFHVRPMLLGTYQIDPRFSRAIVDAETSAASRHSVTYIPVSDGLQRAINEFPAGHWFDEDGMHPGPDLALLEAVRLYQSLFDAAPPEGDVVVSAPMYPPSAHFPVAVIDGSNFEPSNTQFARTHVYSSELVSRIMKLAERN